MGSCRIYRQPASVKKLTFPVPLSVTSVKKHDRPRPGGGYHCITPAIIKRIEPMKIYNIIIAASVLGAVTLSAFPADKPAKITLAPTTRPAAKVEAIVGKVTITSDKVDMAMQRMRTPSRQQALDQLVMQELIEAYARSITYTPKDVDAWKTKMEAELKERKLGTLEEFMTERKLTKDDIPRMVRFEKLEKLAMEIASPEAIASFTSTAPCANTETSIPPLRIPLR